ncbi:uncharacterized protein ACDL77_003720 [Rhynchocyon petersi]
MSGRPEGRPDTHSRLNHSNRVSFPPPRTSGGTHCQTLPGANSFKRAHTPSGSDFGSCSTLFSSPRFPLRQICMGRPYKATCVETSHLVDRPKVASKPASSGSTHCQLCTDHPSTISSPTFLDQLIKGINYLDQSTNSFCNFCPQTTAMSLPRIAASCLEQAANSLHLDQLDQSSQHTYSDSSTITAPLDPSSTINSTSIVPSARGPSTLQCMDNATNVDYTRRVSRRNPPITLPQRPGLKLPELPLFGKGIFSLGHLPKFWEAIRSGWSAPEPISKPSNWW